MVITMATTEQDLFAVKETPNAVLEKIHEWKGVGENLLKSLVDCFECRERDVILARESLEKREKDLEERERKFYLFEEEKKGELMLREENLDEQLKLVREHIQSLEAEQSKIEGFRKLKEIENREREIEKREKEFERMSEKLRKEKKELGEEVKLVNEKLVKKQKAGCDLIEKVELALKLLERMKSAVDERLKEMESWEANVQGYLTAKLKEADFVKESLEKRFQDLDKIDQQFNLLQEKKTQELELKEQQLRAYLGVKLSPKDAENKQSILEMLINTTGKDLELMDDDDIFKLLLMSSDPAKFVLDTVGASKEPKLCIVLLEQLSKWSPIIQPSLRGKAIKLALEWMSNLNTCAENPLKVLVLLHLLAAYNLSSHFDKNELFAFANLVIQHKQTPHLCRLLGLADKIPDIIQNLIHEKQYLLASTYIYEYGLENVFPQAAVLDYYVKHSMMLSKKSFEAQDEAGASEIGDLRVGIEHIIKYGLESEYSPDILRERIKQLERNQGSFKYRSPSSSGDVQKAGDGKRCWDSYRMDLQHEERRYSPPWKAQSRRDGHPYGSSSPGGIYLSRSQKRRRNKAYHDGKPTFDHQ